MLSRRSDDGFTLIELLLAIVILGVITVPLSDVIIGATQTTTTTSDRFEVSHDAQISAAYFAQDVAMTGLRDYSGQIANGTVPYSPSIQVGAAYNAGGQVCGTAATPDAVVRLLSDDWDTTTTPDATRRTAIIAYYPNPAGTELHRLRCLGSATPVSDTIVAHNVKPGTPAVTCASTCADAALPLWVKLIFTAVTVHADPYLITLFGQRRQT
ncbi:prepilin-type N-terminal cleavage/methylation domain-containing protein [Amycolatopsis sp. NPDC051128]|uniref:PulJ/GspJ family protein n=1 Tax=Amycolatopsis sp. NPDC051128 TaxID=3155412 RepID=UPI00341FEBFA